MEMGMGMGMGMGMEMEMEMEMEKGGERGGDRDGGEPGKRRERRACVDLAVLGKVRERGPCGHTEGLLEGMGYLLPFMLTLPLLLLVGLLKFILLDCQANGGADDKSPRGSNFMIS
eukprot:280428-Hanusia_phi.AAC.1